GNLNFDFGKDFNEYFNDRFRGREEMVNLYGARMHLQKNFITKDVLKGDDNWLFLGWKKSIDSYTSRILFSEEELKAINMYLSSIDEYCRSNGKKFYFLIAPDKSKIYGEYYPKSLIPRKGMSRTEIMINYIQGHSNVKVIYPKERLLQEKAEGLLYFKHDTHWNSLGAYYGYEELMKEIVLDFSEIQICSIKKDKNVDNFGDLDNMLPEILRVHDSSKYISPEIIEPRAKISYPAIWNEDFTTSENRYGNRNLLMFRDSFTTALIPYLAESFRLCKCQCKHEVKPSLMKDADVIVLEVVERSLPGLVYQHLNLD
ncbi:MAG TPA: hypothetical protein DDY68_00745, partial [Porphyromonadaceae bacterium]|nr:hypothetical protein [Porphyromonadaceae bacterium]